MSNISYINKTTFVSGNLAGSGSYVDPVYLKNDISLNSVTSSYFKGDGLNITNITSSNITNFTNDVRSKITASNNLSYTNGTASLNNNISLTSVTASNILINSDITINGTASINVLNTLESNVLKIGDKYITIMTGANTQAQLNGAGVLFGSASVGESGDQSSVAHIVYRDAYDKVEIYPGLRVSGSAQILTDVTASKFSGNGAQLTNLISSNISNFTNDVRSQITASNNLSYSNGTASLNNNISLSSVTASAGFSGSLTGSASYALDSDKLDGYHASQFATTASNTFNGNQIITGSVSASSGITGSFSGSGAQLTNLIASNITNFTNEVRAQITASSNLSYTNGTASLNNNISLGSVTASAGFNGSLTGSASYALDSDKLDGYHASQFAITGSNNFNGNQSITGYISASAGITGSFSGSGANISNLTASNITNFSSSVRNVFLPGTNITINAVGSQYAISSSGGSTVFTGGNITGSGASGDPIGIVPNPSFNNVTASVFTGSSAQLNYIDFNTTVYPSPPPPPAQLGRIFYNGASGDLSTYLDTNGLYLNNGQQLVQKVKNNTGATIAKGKVVRVSGSQGSSDLLYVVTASWQDDPQSANTVGLLMSQLTQSQEGYVLLAGVLPGLNTSAYTAGQMLYLSSSGDMTATPPVPPYHTVRLGHVARQANNGSFFVRVQNGYELDELHDVLLNTPTNGDLLVRSSDNLWKNSKILNGSYEITNDITASNVKIDNSLANGLEVSASGDYSHAEGKYTTAYNFGSHAEGYSTVTYGNYSHAEGLYTIASASYQHVQGQYNQTSSMALLLVGNGAGELPSQRSNILEVYSDKMVLSGNLALQPGKGIDFSNGTFTGSNSTTQILSEYEHGTFSPTAGPGFTVTGGKSLIFSTMYEIIGKLVFIKMWVALNDVGGTDTFAASSNNSNAYIESIPYANNQYGTYDSTIGIAKSIQTRSSDWNQTFSQADINVTLYRNNGRIYFPDGFATCKSMIIQFTYMIN